MVGTGTITYLNFEGGFYGIVADNGKHYDPINLPSEYEESGLRVVFIGKVREDLVSFHMWGELIELISIKKL
jgi:inhibitor of cysteine peptidase